MRVRASSKWAVIDSVVTQLLCVRNELELLAPFEAHEMLHQLYEMQDLIQSTMKVRPMDWVRVRRTQRRTVMCSVCL